VPTYQYACTECGHELEAVQSFTDQPLTECPVCDGRLRKLFSSVGIVFKGSGFYRTDSRAAAESGNGKGKESAPAKEPASTGASAEASSSGESSSGTATTAPSGAKSATKSDSKKVATSSTAS
jgi:putative FmdB family regulatory protein